MNDRTLLELAARAAGLGEVWYLDGFDTPYIGKKFQIGRPIEYTTWRPLEDDGDALRLAASLEMDLRFIGAGAIARAHFENSIWPKIKDDDYKRAIVRAAAEIGKSMGGGE
ncbi:hypothetical protein ACQUHS_15070 [Pseudomonas aeruginosa]|uniref:hypothetical protein n=1 Tax=Pseudomonas aeruginosa TaxID=287 RepID=UPI00208E5ADE